MTETLQWPLVDRDSTEPKLLKPFLRREGTKYRQPPGKTGVPVARLIDGTSIKSGRGRKREKRVPAPPGNYIKLKGRCVLSYSSSTSTTLDNRE